MAKALTTDERAEGWARFQALAERELAAVLADHFAAEDRAMLSHLPGALATVNGGGDVEQVADGLAPVDELTAALVEVAAGPLAAIVEGAAARELGEFEPLDRRGIEAARQKGRPHGRKPAYRLPAALRDDVNAKLDELVSAPFWCDISKTRRDRIASAIRQGLTRRESAAQIEARIRALFGPKTAPARAALIARTEANFGVNAGAQVARERLAAAGLIAGKVWACVGDAETRDTHRRANGQTRKVSSKFRVGGYWCLFPGDLSLPPAERCGCRCQCVSVPVDEDE
ncbi:phage minor head protein [Gemmata sp.]|uniref:phage minor head protein n=1 Tax=Gemmata sp. TaxID=1914242 RepID=UPI003F71B904